jgi:GT2 family glycosyltransferase
VETQETVAFCITCKNRTQHLKLTLAKNLADNPGSKFILLDYGSEDDLREWVRANFSKAIHKGHLAIYHYPTVRPFRMAHAKNMAHHLGMLEGGTILVNLDADNFTGPNFNEYISGKFAENPNVFLWANRNQPAAVRYPKGCNGRIAVSAKAFLKVGGYDEKYETWGPDDKDFTFRLKRLGYDPAEIERFYLDVVLHGDRMRFKEYPHVLERWEEEMQQVSETATIANFGRIGCGIVFKNFDWDNTIPINPVPTRIFGIGMHKTATTSLHHALEILGYDSAHWKSAHWAKAIWREMNELGRSPTLERSYALCDLPIPLLYRKLDAAYPGSKFILTIRDTKQWLHTVARHWSSSSNPYRAGWDGDAFTNRIHQILYGRKDFDADTFVKRYQHHNADVLNYFKRRPNDLLVMHMDDGAGWNQLCGFLGIWPSPAVPYPQSFASY